MDSRDDLPPVDERLPSHLEPLPAIDKRLALSEADYEIIDGRVRFVTHREERGATHLSILASLIHAHTGQRFMGALDLLIRTSKFDDFVQDVCVLPKDLDATGRYQAPTLTFELVCDESRRAYATTKAAKLAARIAGRVFMVDLVQWLVLEWSRDLAGWKELDLDSEIIDPSLVMPLSVRALLETKDVSDALLRGAIARRGTEAIAELCAAARAAGREEGRREGRALAVLDDLVARGLSVSEAQKLRIQQERDLDVLDDWHARVRNCSSVDELLFGRRN